MSAPSRRPEIRRRRTRKEKILKLRKSLASASSETDRARFRAKLHRQGSDFAGNSTIEGRVAGRPFRRLYSFHQLPIWLPLSRNSFVNCKSLPSGCIPGKFLYLLVPALFVFVANRLI